MPFFKNVNKDNNQRAIGSPVARENGVKILQHHQRHKDDYDSLHAYIFTRHVLGCTTALLCI